MRWREILGGLGTSIVLTQSADAMQLAEAEAALGHALPAALRELLSVTDGLRGEYDIALVWPLERIVSGNLSFRTSHTFKELYMPFDCLLFFSDAGNGDQFAFTVLAGEIRRSDVFVWNHEDDSRTWVASGLRQFLEGSISGRIAV